MLKKLLGCIREYRRPTVLTPILMIGEVSMECLIPLIIANLVESIEKNCELSVILRYAAVLAGMAIVSLLFGAVAGSTAARASCGFAKNLRHDLYARVQAFSFENIDRFSPASLVTRMTTDVSNVQISFMMIIRTAVRAPLMLVFATVMAFVMGGWLAGVFLVLIPFLAMGLLLVAKKAMPLFRRVFRKYDALNESIEENVRGMRVVKSFVREDYEKQKFDRAAADVCGDFTRAERIVALTGPMMQLCLYLNMVAVMLFGSFLVVRTFGTESAMSVGRLSGMLTYGFQILSSLMMISMIYVIITMSAESARRIGEVLDEAPTIVAPENPITEVADGSIVFDNVSFRYSGRAERYALEGVNLSIPSGETVGIIGGTGSSKSTLIQLICRLYDVSTGSVSVGGVDVRAYDPAVLRDRVAVVLQKNVLFSGTIRDNLRWGKQDATDAEMEQACRLAMADEFIRTFPKGYDTYIEQGGANVSGGQKQRLCIARALLKNPRILILDDSTSAVDTRTDALIRRGLRQTLPSTTKLIIAQRISSVQDADRIVVLDGGRVSDVGTHDQLLARCAIYREVYESQNKGAGAAGQEGEGHEAD